jgi:drug/metabolite transporter (DMT)-like permease
MTNAEDERVRSVDIEDRSALLAHDDDAALVSEARTAQGAVLLGRAFGDVTLMERPLFGAPLWTWAQLVAAVLAISTAGIAFDQLPEVPPLRLASWRMQATSIVLFVGARREWGALNDAAVKTRLLGDTRTMLQLIFSGTCLGAHFGLWVAGLQNTTLSHSLVLVTCTPLCIAFGAAALGFEVSRGELFGAALGVVGVVLVASERNATRPDREPRLENVTWQGDVLSLGAAVATVGYMSVGRALRKWMPLFLYAFPVTLWSAVFLSSASAAFERRAPSSSFGVPLDSIGWLFEVKRFLIASYLALGPGLIGHTGYNGALKVVSPLVVSTFLLLEPVFGSALGWGLGVADAPRAKSGIGGVVVILAVFTVLVAAGKREAARSARRGET